LGREINKLAEDIKKQDKDQDHLTIPLSIKENYYVMFYSDSNKEALPRECKKESCICLLSGKDKIRVECVQTQDIYMVGPTQHYEAFPVIKPIETPRSFNLKITLTARKINELGIYQLEAVEEK